MKQIKCKNCGKLTSNKKFCTRKCTSKYFKSHKISAFFDPKLRIKNVKKAHIINRKNKTGFWDPKVQKKRNITNKKNKTGVWGISKEDRIKNTKKGHITNKKNKTGIYGISREDRIKNVKKAHIINRKNKTGFWNSKSQSEIGRIGGLITAKILREKKCIYWKGNYFDSLGECEIGMGIYYQIEKLIEGINFQKKIGNNPIDFHIKKYDCFIEFHQVLKFINPNETNENYRNSRRKILNKNGFGNSNLIIIK